MLSEGKATFEAIVKIGLHCCLIKIVIINQRGEYDNTINGVSILMNSYGKFTF